MKRLGPCHELVHDRALLLVVGEFSLVGRDLPAQFLEAPFHDLRGGFRIEVVDGDFEQLSADEPSFDRPCLGFGQESRFWLDFEDPQCGLISRGEKINVQGMSSRPINQLLWGITPPEAERRLQDRLGDGGMGGANPHDDHHSENPGGAGHARSFGKGRPFRKQRSRRGFVLVEATIAMSILTVLGLVLFKLSLNILTPRQWALQQTVTDAYMTYERAYAQRVPFETVTAADSPWPISPATTQSTVVLGRLPGKDTESSGSRVISGTIYRYRTADPGNYPIDGGTGTPATNPAGIKVWRLQSVVSYRIGGREYIKSRTVVRTQ